VVKVAVANHSKQGERQTALPKGVVVSAIAILFVSLSSDTIGHRGLWSILLQLQQLNSTNTPSFFFERDY
jgi:hypothetical protein